MSARRTRKALEQVVGLPPTAAEELSQIDLRDGPRSFHAMCDLFARHALSSDVVELALTAYRNGLVLKQAWSPSEPLSSSLAPGKLGHPQRELLTAMIEHSSLSRILYYTKSLPPTWPDANARREMSFGHLGLAALLCGLGVTFMATHLIIYFDQNNTLCARCVYTAINGVLSIQVPTYHQK